MQALYYIDIRGKGTDDKVGLFFQLHSPPEKQKEFLLTLINGVIRHRKALDKIIDDFSSHWKISRMSCVDRNVLRIAVFEILAKDDIPAKVSINEAIDIGKKYGTEDSGAFINGILDSIHQEWNQGRITFEPQVDSDPEMERKEDIRRSNEAAVINNGHLEGTIKPAKPEKRSIFLTPCLRKRVAGQTKEVEKRGGEYDS